MWGEYGLGEGRKSEKGSLQIFRLLIALMAQTISITQYQK